MIYLVLVVHWIADFIAQTDWQAKNKSKNWKALSSHIFVYTLFLTPFGIKFALINGLSHFIIDFFTSRFTGYFFKKGDYHNGFVVVGLDQLLHTMILISTLQFIK